MSETLGYDFDVPYIMLHAITHDPESFPRPCLYCQLDEDEDGPSEMYLVPPREEECKQHNCLLLICCDSANSL
jgi:hypothetical protein